MSVRVVVVGGTGNFGARICRRLRQEPGIEVIATGRRAVETSNGVLSSELDIDSTRFAEALGALAPQVVTHCAGPYQGQDYRVAEAALACGAHYIDLADGREFVVQFSKQVDVAARAAGRVAVTGASTLPALSSAVIDHLGKRFSRIKQIEIAIAPGQRAPRGTATMQAVLGYAGEPLQWWTEGEWQTAHGWQELRRIRFPYGTRCAAACDVPDLELLPERYPDAQTVTFHAALELPVEHYALWSLAALRRLGVRLPMQRWARTLNRIGGWLDRFGTDCGGMRVSVAGDHRSGGVRRATWQLVAKSNHGPEIPCMAAILLTLKVARGEALSAGARPCVGLLQLGEFDAEFSRWNITSSIEESAA
jgi:saccharopine dehydrogenase-like NADP-dependent oxidoreductase